MDPLVKPEDDESQECGIQECGIQESECRMKIFYDHLNECPKNIVMLNLIQYPSSISLRSTWQNPWILNQVQDDAVVFFLHT